MNNSVLTTTDGAVRVDKQLVNKFLFDGKIWTLQFDGTSAHTRDMVGMHFIKQLLQRPRVERRSWLMSDRARGLGTGE